MDKTIVNYDGKCGLCNRSRRLIESLDYRQQFEFQDLNQLDSDQTDIPTDSISVQVNNKLLTKSDALIKITSKLELVGHFAFVFKLIPRTIRNNIYDKIAEHRQRFNRQSSCKNNCLSDNNK